MNDCGEKTTIQLDKQTYTFKHVENLEIKADVHKSLNAGVQPAIIWIHGGALMGGTRSDVNADQIRLYAEAGYTIISIDYRLAPQTKIASIIEDLKDAIIWVHDRGPDLFKIDPDRIAVIGHSAGGYLTLMSGVVAGDMIKALVPVYGYGDIIGAWYSRPDPYYCKLPKEEPHTNFYLYCRQNGLWPKEVTGFDPDTEPEMIYPYCPIRNIALAYPPALLVHGDIDTDVPCAQSILMAYELLKAGVDHELLIISGGGHGFDWDMKKPEVAETFKRILEFLGRHV